MGEYVAYLRRAQDAGYAIVPMQRWLCAPDLVPPPVLLLRHDVDAYTPSAVEISDAEQRLGVTSTFYFRWCTWSSGAAARIRANGSDIGLHYETLTRYAIGHDLRSPEAITDDVVATCRSQLRKEIQRFTALAGECRSVVAHGDYRRHLIGTTNDSLLIGEQASDYGLEVNGDDPGLASKVDAYVVDGEGFPTYWSGGTSFPDALRMRPAVLLFNSHPHHWVRGSRVLRCRISDELRLIRHHPLSWTRGRAEAVAWDAYA